MTPAKGITMSRIHAEDLRSLHQHIDELVKLDGVKGFDFSLTVYLAEGVARAFAFGKGKVPAEDRIRTDLRLLADKCRKLGTNNALAMLPAIGECIRHLERLYVSNDEGTAPAQTASEVVQ